MTWIVVLKSTRKDNALFRKRLVPLGSQTNGGFFNLNSQLDMINAKHYIDQNP